MSEGLERSHRDRRLIAKNYCAAELASESDYSLFDLLSRQLDSDVRAYQYDIALATSSAMPGHWVAVDGEPEIPPRSADCGDQRLDRAGARLRAFHARSRCEIRVVDRHGAGGHRRRAESLFCISVRKLAHESHEIGSCSRASSSVACRLQRSRIHCFSSGCAVFHKSRSG